MTASTSMVWIDEHLPDVAAQGWLFRQASGAFQDDLFDKLCVFLYCVIFTLLHILRKLHSA